MSGRGPSKGRSLEVTPRREEGTNWGAASSRLLILAMVLTDRKLLSVCCSRLQKPRPKHCKSAGRDYRNTKCLLIIIITIIICIFSLLCMLSVVVSEAIYSIHKKKKAKIIIITQR